MPCINVFVKKGFRLAQYSQEKSIVIFYNGISYPYLPIDLQTYFHHLQRPIPKTRRLGRLGPM